MYHNTLVDMNDAASAALTVAPPATCAILASIGWEILSVEIDLVAGRALLDIRREDGRWLRLSADALGRASIERWQRDRAWQRSSRRAASYEGVADTFLGRERHEGPRQALRYLSHYVAENPAPGRGALPVGAVKSAVAALLGGGVQ